MPIAQDTTGGSSLGILLPLLLFAAIFYFLIIRPARNRQRQAAAVHRSLTPGIEVMTTAGLIATVSAVEDDVVTLEVAPGVRCRYDKRAVMRVLTPTEPEPSAGPEETEPTT